MLQLAVTQTWFINVCSVVNYVQNMSISDEDNSGLIVSILGHLQQVLPSTTEVAELTTWVYSVQIDEGDFMLDDLIVFHNTHP